MSKYLPALVLSLSALTSPFVSAQELPPNHDEEVATINGQPVTRADLFAYVQVRSPQLDVMDEAVQTQLLQGYIGRELLYQDAMAKKIDQDPLVQAVIKEQVHSILAQALATELLKENPITDEMLKEAFQKHLKENASVEYNVAHIMTESGEAAEKALARLNKGETFAAVAKDSSADSNAAHGGELGWMPKEAMPPAFASAVQTLKPGSHTSEVVQTQYGWHIIKLLETRPASPPDMQQLQPQLTQSLQREIIENHLEALRQAAKVEEKK